MTSPNIILIVVDCLRPDQLGCYGAQESAAPTIDHLAANGVVFEQAIAAGFHTLTTMPVLLSGGYPSAHGGFRKFSSARPSLPELLQARGFQTAGFVPNPYLSKSRGYHRGFGVFDECPPPLPRRVHSVKGLAIRGLNRALGRWGIGIECPPYLNGREVTDRAIRWLGQTQKPFFLWLHFMDAHTPYNLQQCSLLFPKGRGQRPYPYGFWRRLVHQPSSLTEQELTLARQLYTDGIKFIDHQIRRLIDFLRGEKLFSNTVLVVTADHGEAFLEHGACGHSNFLYDEVLHVPLVIGPGDRGKSGIRVADQVSQLDIPLTLLALAGGNTPRAMCGISLLPALKGDDLPTHLHVISQTNPARNWMVSLRAPPWKLIWQVDPGTLESRGVELYNLTDDPSEKINLATQYPDMVSQMQAKLINHIVKLDFGEFFGPGAGSIDPVLRERLRALGYLEDG